ncbi:DNA-binding protein [Pseudomonas sp. SCA2728.1_7]|uniref:winged helix-turn-helix domain-containing protein n=1 Tax=Pseudomonas sp. SCA2728.1_7 TaxID=2825975 RepID=UPI001BAF89EE|nr:DNA-binding protein [Pseudomonas sp. SCA2728.1_7]QUE93197.1 DNA-binding protein [Pseudomonas sp. SCA2728.1_7]
MEQSEGIGSGASASDCYYDAEKMTLSRARQAAVLGSNESDLLLALIAGVTDKEQLISRVWGERGLVISDSSYYKTLHMLRAHFAEVGLPRDSLKTLPRRGVVLLCEIRLLSAQTQASESPPALVNDAEPFIVDAPTVKKPFSHYWRFLLPAILVPAIALPVFYAYLVFKKPADLEEWKLIWQEGEAKLYVEESERMSKEDIVQALSEFEPPIVLSDINYYVRKPLSQLLVKCIKPESKGEAICVNYQLVGKK